MEKEFPFAQASYPCYLLDEELNIVQANAAVQLPYTPGMVRTLLSDTDIAALRCGQPVQLPWNYMPDTVCSASILPMDSGYTVVVQPVASRPDSYRRMLEKTTGALHGLLMTLPALHHFMEDDSQGIQMLEYSMREGYRALRTVSSQHWCARLAAGSPLELQLMNLDEVLASLCQAITTALTDVEVLYEGPALPVYVNADRALMDQILCHAIGNAVLYGGEDRKVIVRLQKLRNRAAVHIADAGKGIQAQTAPHVFEAYYSCDPYCDTEERPGDGLGLYLVQQGLRAMGGECAMESEFGRGTQLSFTLPLTEDEQPVVRASLADYLLDRFSCVYMHFCPLGGRLWA